MKMLGTLPHKSEQFLSLPIINPSEKRLSTYIFSQFNMSLNLGWHEYDVSFMNAVLQDEDKPLLADIYLSYLEQYNNDKKETLRHKNGNFELEEVLNAFSGDIKSDYSQVKRVLYTFAYHTKQKYVDTTPLKEMLAFPPFKHFANGLGLSYKQAAFFALNVANCNWYWLFPQNAPVDYKARLFAEICGLNLYAKTDAVRALNTRFLRLGLFDAPWQVCGYVHSFFMGENVRCHLERCRADENHDIYDYEDIATANEDAVSIATGLCKDFLANGNGCYQLFCGDDVVRQKNFLSFVLQKHGIKLFELQGDVDSITKDELAFYIYAFCAQLKGNNAALLLDRPVTKLFASKAHRHADSHMLNAKPSLLANVQIPVILCCENTNAQTKETLLENGIDVLFDWQLKTLNAKQYPEKMMRYFFNQHVSEKYLSVAVDECMNLHLSPQDWDGVASLMRNVSALTKEEAHTVLQKKYSHLDDAAIRKNTHYSLAALNTTESIDDFMEALQNADEFQHGEYDSSSGVRILLHGISGGGKTSLVEETARQMKKPLKIVRASDVLGNYVGETEQNIKRTFDTAAKEKAILLIDEADSFLHERGDKVNMHNDLKVNEFLVQMERYPGILFCSTNLPENLDTATDRRFHFKIGFKPLTKDGVRLLCKSYFGDYEALDEMQIAKIYDAGNVTPGDFGVLAGKMRFISQKNRNADYICRELCRIVQTKGNGKEHKKIGFGA